ncbi:MAG TPA: hypothetical protein VG722_06515, partial [Tepidisphaeraceae bacterium]|nr:hypothetical protein [Tepidisphaeraceae bacterium]
GTLTGQFAGLNEGSLVRSDNGVGLFITYQGNGGHQVDLYTGAIAVPTPAAWAGGMILLGIGGAMNAWRRRQRA